jgi:excisionase family DNA binding protein
MSTSRKKPPQSTQNDNSGEGSLIRHLETRITAMRAGDVAKLLSFSPTQVYRMAETGKLPCFRIGTAVRFDPGIIAKWLREKRPGA